MTWLRATIVFGILRNMAFGAMLLALIEKWRRDVFTTDDVMALLMLVAGLGVIEGFSRRRAGLAGGTP